MLMPRLVEMSLTVIGILRLGLMLILWWILIGKRRSMFFPCGPIFSSFFWFSVLIFSIDKNGLEPIRNSLTIDSSIVKNQYFCLLEFLSLHTFFIVKVLPE